MDKIKSFIQKNDQFAKSNGIELMEVQEGYARARMTLRKEHMNSVATCHGGAIFTLADLAFAAAVNSHGTMAVAINVNISYIKAAIEGDVLTAEARETALHTKLAVCSVAVTDQANAIVALFQGTAYRKNRDLLVNGKLNTDLR